MSYHTNENPAVTRTISHSMENGSHSHLSSKRLSLLKTQQRAQLFRAFLIGILAGIVAVVFHHSIYLLEQVRHQLLKLLHGYPEWGWMIFPVIGAAGGAAAAFLTSRYAPEAAGSGIPHVKAVLLNLRPFRWARVLLVKFFGGLLSLGSGFSLGREGPTVQMGAAIGKMVSEWFSVSHQAEKRLIAAGGGAGLAAAFNAPLAGFIFVIEEFHMEMSTFTYGTALIASVVADMVTRTYHGQLPNFLVFRYPTPPLSAIPFFALLGIIAGLVGVFFNKLLIKSVRFVKRRNKEFPLITTPWIRAAAIGVLVGAAIWVIPEATGGGNLTVEGIINGNFNSEKLIPFACAILVVKFFLTIFCYLAGIPGGIFAPLLVLGALVGYLVGQLSATLLPAMGASPASFAVTGMAAIFASIVHAPLTGIALILEMTGNYHQMFAMLVACSISYLTAEWFGCRPVYEGLLALDIGGKEFDLSHPHQPRIVDVVLQAGSPISGKTLREIHLSKGCLLVTVTRDEKEIVPDGDTMVLAGDQLEFIVSKEIPGLESQIHDLARNGKNDSQPEESPKNPENVT